MKTLNKKELKNLILNGITTEELKGYNYSHITDMSDMFYSCKSLTSIPELDTSNVIIMSEMFTHCTSLTSIPELNTSNVINMNRMFSGCTSLISVPYLDTAKVKYTYCMFYGCTNIEHCFYDSRINYNESNSTKLKQKHPEYFI